MSTEAGEIKQTPQECDHPWDKRVFRSGYNPANHQYVRDNYCTQCNKRWTETSK